MEFGEHRAGRRELGAAAKEVDQLLHQRLASQRDRQPLKEVARQIKARFPKGSTTLEGSGQTDQGLLPKGIDDP